MFASWTALAGEVGLEMAKGFVMNSGPGCLQSVVSCDRRQPEREEAHYAVAGSRPKDASNELRANRSQVSVALATQRRSTHS